MDLQLVMGAIISLIFSIFFAGMETAFLSSNKLQLELLGKQGNLSAQIMIFFSKKNSWFIGTTLIGNIISLVFFGIFSALLILPSVQDIFPSFAARVVIPTFVIAIPVSILVLYSVELLSKGFFVIHSNKIVSVLAIPFTLISAALFPLVFLVVSLARFVAESMKLPYSKERPVFGLTDVNEFLKSIRPVKREAQNVEVEARIFTNALEFKTVRVRDCMIPRTEIAAVSLDSGIKKLREAFLETGHSKILIFRESIDDVIGYCHSTALFKMPQKIEEILTPIITAPETMLARELMVKFINERKSLAVVVDEFGGTSGMVSMEDVIEEIFGEIEDEHDEYDENEHKIDQNTYLLSARLEIDYLNEKYKWDLPTGDYDTLSGLILSLTEDLPEEGQAVMVGNYTFIVQSTEENRIDTVKLIVGSRKESD